MSSRLGFVVAAAWMLLPSVAAAESVTVSIQTTVLPVCRFMGSTALPSSLSGVAADGPAPTGGITYQCTNGVAPSFAITASAGCSGCPDGSSNAAVIVSDSRTVGRGMGTGRELTLVVAGSVVAAPMQTALSDVSITVSP